VMQPCCVHAASACLVTTSLHLPRGGAAQSDAERPRFTVSFQGSSQTGRSFAAPGARAGHDIQSPSDAAIVSFLQAPTALTWILTHRPESSPDSREMIVTDRVAQIQRCVTRAIPKPTLAAPQPPNQLVQGQALFYKPVPAPMSRPGTPQLTCKQRPATPQRNHR
jgi:hypothetical protein